MSDTPSAMREQAAQICESLQVNRPDDPLSNAFDGACRACAEAIREAGAVGRNYTNDLEALGGGVVGEMLAEGVNQMSLICKHGQLARSCEICELERELAEAKRDAELKEIEIGKLRAEVLAKSR